MTDPTGTVPPNRGRATSLGPHDRYLLDEWARSLEEAFGETPFLVGSVARASNKWRDVDVRMLSDWADDPEVTSLRVRALNMAVSLWGRQATGLPIDFQFQRAELFHLHDGEERNALFVHEHDRSEDPR